MPETVTGTKKRSVQVKGVSCDGDDEATCEKECPGKQSGFELVVIIKIFNRKVRCYAYDLTII